MNTSSLIQKVWNFCHTLRDDGVGYGDYLEQLTYLLFLKMAHEYSQEPYNRDTKIPKGYDWLSLRTKTGEPLEAHYLAVLHKLGTGSGMLGAIFFKAQNKIQDPACGTGGFFLAANDWLVGKGDWIRDNASWINHPALTLDKKQKEFLRHKTFYGNEIVPNTRRMCLMNLFLHNIGELDGEPAVDRADALIADSGKRFDYVLANPPFGKKSSMTITNEEGEEDRDALTYERQDFWETTSNKQLNFLQHIVTILKQDGKSAVVLPDNVLFEGGAGEKIRKKLLENCDVHTLLRLPTGVFYAQGVKANVLFFDAKPKDGNVHTKGVWIYDLRTNKHFTLKTKPLKLDDLRDFITSYNPENRHERKETERFKYFPYKELVARDKASLDIFWLKDDSLDNMDDLPPPDILAQEIIEHLEAALASFRDVAEGLIK